MNITHGADSLIHVNPGMTTHVFDSNSNPAGAVKGNQHRNSAYPEVDCIQATSGLLLVIDTMPSLRVS